MTTISNELPAGNIRVVSQQDNLFILSEEQRDSGREWFYWKFKAVFDAPGHYVFRFERPNKVGTRSAAVSLDRGLSWNWLSQEFYPDTQEFAYDCAEPGEVWFCQAIPYLQREFNLFAQEFAGHPAFHLSTLCQSRKGRDVELVTIREGNPAHTIFMSSRHHCQEMAATHALEGIMRAVLADDAFGRAFRRDYALLVVPFVDKDGAEDGDQGKGRIPRDHGRDYHGDAIYPETRAIRELIARERPFLVLDLHCPWLRNGITNEQSYVVENCVPRFQAEIARLSQLLERRSVPCAPFRACHKIRWGVSWNRNSNSGTGASYGKGIGPGNEHHPFVRLACTIEIPFANFGAKTMTRYEFLQYGASIAHAVADYGTLSLQPDSIPANATLCLTGDIMSQCELDAACARPDGSHDYREVLCRVTPLLRDADCCVGNLETSFAGPDAGYSSKLYSFNTPDAFADALVRAGFSLVSTANNHCLDRGVSGLFRTLDILDQRGIEHTGTSRSPEEQDKPLIRYVNGFRLGFVASTYGTNAFANHTFLKPEEAFAVNLSQPQETLPGSVHLLDPMDTIARNVQALPAAESPEMAHLRQAIEATRAAGADYVIALMHSGGQYNPQPDAYTERLVQAFLDAGADMIVGNHPHVIQKFAWRDGRPVFHCLGNLITTPSQSPAQQAHPECFNSVIVRPVLQRDADGHVRMASATFRVLHSHQLPNGVTAVTPLHDLLVAATSPQQRDDLAQQLRRAVRAFLDLPQDADVALQPEYDLPGRQD